MLEEKIIKELCHKGKNVSVAESCTGGLICGRLTNVPGSSRCFGYGVVTYSNNAKNQMLGVPWEVLNRYGAVSSETAELMARGVRKLADSHIGLAVTGIAGPDGGTETKPIGLVYVAVDRENESFCRRFLFTGSREEIRQQTIEEALKMILCHGVD